MIWPLLRGLGRNLVNFFVGIFVQTMTPKGHFEINWPLVTCAKTRDYAVHMGIYLNVNNHFWLFATSSFSNSKLKRWWKMHVEISMKMHAEISMKEFLNESENWNQFASVTLILVIGKNNLFESLFGLKMT